MSDDWERYKSGEISEKEYHRLKHARDRERRNAVMREYYRINKDAFIRRNNTQKYRVRLKTIKLINNGWLIRPDSCPRCGATDRPIEVHHKHYDRPDSATDVEFMCEPCHTKKHQSDAPTVP